ncbi:hypothetical protein QTV44_002505 [Vibrio vulnificus]|nr:hypothetical protein [Vibrio vulnificus]
MMKGAVTYPLDTLTVDGSLADQYSDLIMMLINGHASTLPQALTLNIEPVHIQELWRLPIKPESIDGTVYIPTALKADVCAPLLFQLLTNLITYAAREETPQSLLDAISQHVSWKPRKRPLHHRVNNSERDQKLITTIIEQKVWDVVVALGYSSALWEGREPTVDLHRKDKPRGRQVVKLNLNKSSWSVEINSTCILPSTVVNERKLTRAALEARSSFRFISTLAPVRKKTNNPNIKVYRGSVQDYLLMRVADAFIKELVKTPTEVSGIAWPDTINSASSQIKKQALAECLYGRLNLSKLAVNASAAVAKNLYLLQQSSLEKR